MKLTPDWLKYRAKGTIENGGQRYLDKNTGNEKNGSYQLQNATPHQQTVQNVRGKSHFQ